MLLHPPPSSNADFFIPSNRIVMALDAAVFPQDLFDCSLKDLFGYDIGDLLIEFDDEQAKEFGEWGVDLSSSLKKKGVGLEEVVVERIKKRRRRAKSCKNEEEVENQRMTHIAVERNRRKLMNEYLSVLRSMMPPGYVYRGDQASIVGGAINFVKELEQLLQTLEAQRRSKHHLNFADSFKYSHCSSDSSNKTIHTITTTAIATTSTNNNATETISKKQTEVAEIEVNMVENHANVKVLSKRLPKQLLKMVAGLQSLRFTVLHLNVVTAADRMALYSFSLKVEDECPFRSVDEITTALYQMVCEIEESVCN